MALYSFGCIELLKTLGKCWVLDEQRFIKYDALFAACPYNCLWKLVLTLIFKAVSEHSPKYAPTEPQLVSAGSVLVRQNGQP